MKRTLEGCALLALALAVMLTPASAQEARAIEGPWQTQVHVYNCDTGATVRDVSALNLFMHDGSITETAVNIMRTSSVGTWKHVHGNTYRATFWFYRYTPAFTLASLARAENDIVLNGDHFDITGSVTDTFPDGSSSESCVTITGERLQ
jgi:hypothetical protein